MSFDIEELLAIYMVAPSPPPSPSFPPPPADPSTRQRQSRQLQDILPPTPPPPKKVTGTGEIAAMEVLKGAISTQINIAPQFIELELDGTIVSIDIFIGGEKGAPIGNLTGTGGDDSSGGTGGTGGSGGGQSIADVAAAQTAQIADSTMKYAEEILLLTMKPSFMGDLSGTMAVPIYIVERPILQVSSNLNPHPYLT